MGNTILKLEFLLGLLFFAAALNGCGTPYEVDDLEAPSLESIVNTSAYPPVVKVIMPGGLGLCSGTFVSSRAVLTAAHCTLASGNYTVISTFGTYTTNVIERLGSGTVGDVNDLSVLILSTDAADKTLGQVYPVSMLNPTYREKVRLVGFGCNDIDTRRGAGTKRTGTNQVARVSSYVELVTPVKGPETLRLAKNSRSLVGPENRAGSCFGDSGGPMLRSLGRDKFAIIGVSHGGSWSDEMIVSLYSNTVRTENQQFLSSVNDRYDLDLFNACDGIECDYQSASTQIANFFRILWNKFFAWF